MQTILHDYTNISPLFNQIEKLYTDISYEHNNISTPLFPFVLDSSFLSLCDTLKANIEWFDSPYTFSSYGFEILHPIERDDTVIICISGGKDSLALTKLCVDMGYNVYLYHMKGINKVYSDEYKAVQKIAKYFDLPLYIDTVILSGTQCFTEHPMKNMIIANGALHYALANDLGTNIVFGNFFESYLEDNDFNVCAGDCMDLWYDYDILIRTIIPHFSIKVMLRNNEETLEIIERDPKLLDLAVSCMSPYRFRNHWKKRTEKKYNIALPNNRCGCCWKCAMEYIYFADKGIYDYNEAYYLHCLEILYATKVKESNSKDWSLLEIWEQYLFYSITDSKAREVLNNAIISNGKIKRIQ